MNGFNSLREIGIEVDPIYTADSNLQHLKNMFWGYREEMLGPEETQPFSPRSAGDCSFQKGRQLAQLDKKRIASRV